jgi:acetyl-CoA carboxylase carboxyltransferase component
VPVPWKPELEELARRTAFAHQMGGEERLARARAEGRRSVRERLGRLLDPGSFHETGALAGRPEYDEQGQLRNVTPSNFVCGRGRIAGRPVVVGADDFSVRGGAADGAVGNKMGWAEKAARELRIPVVVSPAAQQVLRLASSHGYGRKDFTSIYQFLKPSGGQAPV